MALKKNPKFDLKLKYRKTLETSLIVALVLLIAAFKFFPEYEKAIVESEPPPDVIKVIDVINTKDNLEPPPPPKPPIPIEAPTDDLLSDFEFDNSEIDLKEDLSKPLPLIEDEEENEGFIFIPVEEMPEPIGGIGAIQRKIVYPEIARRAGVQGKVFVNAYVDEVGNVVKVELIKGIGAGCDEAAMNAVLTTKFKPGKQRGKPVKVRVTVPIRFKLQ